MYFLTECLVNVLFYKHLDLLIILPILLTNYDDWNMDDLRFYTRSNDVHIDVLFIMLIRFESILQMNLSLVVLIILILPWRGTMIFGLPHFGPYLPGYHHSFALRTGASRMFSCSYFALPKKLWCSECCCTISKKCSVTKGQK